MHCRDTPGIVAGDFNVALLGTDDARTGVLQRLFPAPHRRHTSICHHYFGEECGGETRPIYFHRRKPDDPLHIVHESL